MSASAATVLYLRYLAWESKGEKVVSDVCDGGSGECEPGLTSADPDRQPTADQQRTMYTATAANPSAPLILSAPTPLHRTNQTTCSRRGRSIAIP